MLAFLKKLFRRKTPAPLMVGEVVVVANTQQNRINHFWEERIGKRGFVVQVHPNGDLTVQMDEDPEGITCDFVFPARFTRSS